MGSGKLLKRAFNKYGIENFEKQILEYFDDATTMYHKEYIIVNEQFVNRPDTYNMKIGGHGFGMTYDERKSNSERAHDACREKRKNDPEFAQNVSNKLSKHAKNLRSQGLLNNCVPEWAAILGREKAMSPESREKQKKSFHEINHQQGEKNSQFGTCWVWHEIYGNKKIDKTLLDEYLADGWVKTRKLGYKPKI